ncbi:flavin depend monooxygenase that catalyses the oxidation of rubrofusarin to 9-hydroxyrubrofusarin [Fusarium proliferatum ET1]|uniref:Flavin depend monooxygenase that catalyses the oxidation of rubrofusarin to 9-hydroxyrubrofusarin n=1 Tax=Fusarium proliferatum (strain ET1) TaxID=1227346 RepID=A0A1L7VSJ4_FUSPR|nr:flavin depend monooxygenase that catalyses the oxidation of rubrofusarin to 9-hydroxyrubrofusarin [Fusarium proliferatum ET1]CZR42675.1 flavin depend monooxygenase that catalyses the oxidation of rubrofusarin to 9-hydroxyrubrofusarin [Fusarium proliferatum ET1]
MDKQPQKVAVVGLGIAGLVAVKNLLEVGFDVTGFERSGYVGGLWHYTEQDKTSVLPSTIINISKERASFTDFPYPDSTPSHCPSAKVQEYIESYVDHFNFRDKLRLGVSVEKVRRDDAGNRWVVDIKGSEPEYFDKVIMATGGNNRPHIPKVEGMEQFEGDVLHSRAFKRPELFKGKRVVVVGVSNTGADTAAALCGHAEKVWLSRSHGVIVIPRKRDGIPFDHTLTARTMAFMGMFESAFPRLYELIFNAICKKMQDNAFKIRPEWGLSPAISVLHALPVISDNLIPLLESGDITSVPKIKRVTGPREIELTDGKRLDVDTIIWCTGYEADFSLLDPSVDPTRNTTPKWAEAIGSRGKPLPRLYQNVFSLDYPDSLAFMGNLLVATSAFPISDICTMAIAQIWKENSPLPSIDEMNRATDKHHETICKLANRGSVVPGWLRQSDWLAWADKAAGSHVYEHLGWGLKGWKLWWNDRALYRMLMDGIFTPFVWRVFDGEGKRKKWDGAREAIEKVNAELAAAKARNKNKKSR